MRRPAAANPRKISRTGASQTVERSGTAVALVGCVLRFLSFAVALLVPSIAAASTVVAKSGGYVSVAEERVAFSTTERRTVSFEQLRFASAMGEVAWLVPVPKGGSIELGDPSFLASLDQATAPVLQPVSALGCGTGAVSTASADDPVPPAMLGVKIDSPLHAATVLSGAGYDVEPIVKVQLAALESAGEDVAIVELGAGELTPMMRVVGPAGRTMPTSFVGSPFARLHGFVLSNERVQLADATTLQLEFGRLRWEDTGPSFAALLDLTLKAAPEGMVVTFAEHRGLLSAQPAIPSLAERYLADSECISRALASAESSSTVVADAPGDAELAAATFTCGKRDDLAVALVGLAPGDAWLTRFEAATAKIDGKLAAAGRVALPSFHDVVLGGCTRPSSGPTGTPATPAPYTPSDSSSSDSGDDGQAAGEACAMALDGCSRSSSSGSSSGEGCGGDTSDSSSDSCDSGSSGSSGDSCSSGPATSTSDDGCHLAASFGWKSRRPRLSPILLSMVAFATILRRRGRRTRGMIPSPQARWQTPLTSNPLVSKSGRDRASDGCSPTSGSSND